MSFKKFILFLVIGLLVTNIGLFAIYHFYLSLPAQTTDKSIEQSDSSSEKVADDTTEEAVSDTESAPETEPIEQVFSDKYYSLHFNYSDAVDVCVQEVRSRNSNLIQLALNDLSSRFNDREGFFMIRIDTYVGTPFLYDEKEHTCHIDPKTQGVAYYREFIRRKAVRPVK